MHVKLLRFIKVHWQDIFILLTLIISGCVIPYFWLKGGYMIAGHDAGMPFDPVEHYWDRIYTWSERIGFGSDNTQNVGALGIHTLEALVFRLTGNLHVHQVILLAFWLILPGIAMFLFVRSVFGPRFLLTLFAPLFYMYNHLLLQALWIFERTKFSLYAVLPLIALILIRFFRKQTSALRAGAMLSFVLFFLNGGGFLPLFGAVIVVMFVATAYFLVTEPTKNNAIQTLKFLTVFFVLSFFLQSYWILGYTVLIQNALNEQLASLGGIDSVISWATYISSESSLFNLLRLQGIIDWYGNQNHPYATMFLFNPFLQLVSFTLAPLAFVSLLFTKDKKDQKVLILLALIALLSMIFIGGTHEPLGFIFMFFMRYVPGFAVFRSPFYKFAPALWFAYAVLIGYSLWYTQQKLLHLLGYRKILGVVFAVLIFIIFCVYNYPYFTGSFFDYIAGKRTTKIFVPRHVTEFGEYVQKYEPHQRLLLLPPPSNISNADTFVWRYWSLAPVTSLLTNTVSLTVRADNRQAENDLVTLTNQAFAEGDSVWDKLLFTIGADSIVLRKDFAVQEDSQTLADLSAYEQKLKDSPLIASSKAFGPWILYTLKPEYKRPVIAILPTSAVIAGSFQTPPTQLDKDYFSLLKLNDIDAKTNMQILNLTPTRRNIVQANDQYWLPLCTFCTLQDEFPSIDRGEKILPFSFFFPFVQHNEEKSLLEEKDWKQRERIYFDIFSKRTYALRGAMQARTKQASMFIKTENALIKAVNDVGRSLEQSTGNVDEDNDRLLKMISYLYVAKEQITQRMKDNPFQIEQPVLTNAFEVVDSTIVTFINKLWRSDTEFEKKYTVNIEQAAKFDALLDLGTLGVRQNIPTLAVVTLSIDDTLVPISLQPVGGDWVKLVSLELTQGIHKILLIDNTVKNIFSIPQESKDANKHITFGAISFSFEASILDQQCMSFPLNNLTKGDYYKISFTYSIPDQYRGMYFKWDKDKLSEASMIIKGNRLLPTTQPQTYEKIDFVSHETMYLNFCSDFDLPENIKKHATFSVSDIAIKKLSTPALVLHKRQETPSATASVSYERLNPTIYAVRVTNPQGIPFLLSFAQRYDRNWRLYPVSRRHEFKSLRRVNPEIPAFQAKSTDHFFDLNLLQTFITKPIADDLHVLTSGYANGWWLDGTSNQDYLLVYEKQKWYLVGLGLSLIAFLASLYVILRSRT